MSPAKPGNSLESQFEAIFKQEGSLQTYEDEHIPVVVIPSFPELGKLVALRFIEWIQQYPEGVVSLPTGKTPEYFIRWMNQILSNWESDKIQQMLKKYQIPSEYPDFSHLHFVQIDDFFPIPHDHPNSFISYVTKHYLKGFGLDVNRALLMDFRKIAWPQDLSPQDIFPDQSIDLSLRTRTPKTEQENIQREAIFTLDTFAQDYEQKIRDLGGIGFFLGGIGPDGHIAFNVRGADFFSTTRLTYTNFETQAASATDLGGIENSASKAVMTIGLGTITYNPEVVAIIMAKAAKIAEAVTQEAGIRNPCSVLQRVNNARMYITQGAASKLPGRVLAEFESHFASDVDKIVQSVVDATTKHHKKIVDLSDNELHDDQHCAALMESKNLSTADLRETAVNEITERLERGSIDHQDKRFLHTGPHHDDILLGYLPSIIHQVRSATNLHHFAIMTSGFTSVPNGYVSEMIQHALDYLDHWAFRYRWETNYFDQSELQLRNKDTHRFLNGLVAGNDALQKRSISRRVIRAVMEIYGRKDLTGLRDSLEYIGKDITHRYPGQTDPKDIQTLKGTLREFEEDLAWAHFGFDPDYVHHLRLAFYTGEYFTEEPSETEDIPPIRDLFTKVKPDIITLAFDPEASGPDTHYKVLQAITAHLAQLPKNAQDHLEIWGYRNVWHRFHPGEANMYVPVSINSMHILDRIFKSCYLTQKDASFPSHEHAGPFSELAQRIMVEQYQTLRVALGPEFWYRHEKPRYRGTQGILFMRSMKFEELSASARSLAASVGRI
jgi:glucosamine-6-phosphate deaminase